MKRMNTNTEVQCTCTNPAVACSTCLANRDRNGWPKNWQERMGRSPGTASQAVLNEIASMSETELNRQVEFLITRAAVAVVTADGYAIGYADENVAGYTPTPYTYESYETAQSAARAWNERSGLSLNRVSEIVLSTMKSGR